MKNKNLQHFLKYHFIFPWKQRRQVLLNTGNQLFSQSDFTILREGKGIIKIITISYTVCSGMQDALISKLEGKKSVLYSRLSNFYVDIRRYIFKFLVLYSRPSYNKGRLLFPRIRPMKLLPAAKTDDRIPLKYIV